MTSDPIVITGMARTAIGGFQGELASLTAPQLGAAAIGAALARAGVAAEDLDAARIPSRPVFAASRSLSISPRVIRYLSHQRSATEMIPCRWTIT